MKKLDLSVFREHPSLRHLKRLTTNRGIIQHADHEVPDPAFGYSIDDNARALIVCLWHYKLYKDSAILQLAEIYFDYIKRVEKEGGSFHNFLSFSEKILDPEGSEDSIGRAIWALGEVVAHHPSEEVVKTAQTILERTKIDRHLEHPHIRTKAYILLGLLAAGKKEEAKKWAIRLAEIFEQNASSDWPWFENGLYYANGILPYVMAQAAIAFEDERFKKIAVQSFDWLDQVSRQDIIPAPIGQNGWYIRGQEKALYDQQPLEAADMVLAAAELNTLTGEEKYLEKALEWQDWYKGGNISKTMMIDTATGGVYDGLLPKGVNKNQGAESIVTYLLAYLALSKNAQN